MVIENINISKNVDDTFMIRAFIDNKDEMVEIILDKVILEDLILKQENVISNLIGKEDIDGFRVNLEGIALYEKDGDSSIVGKILRHPKTND